VGGKAEGWWSHLPPPPSGMPSTHPPYFSCLPTCAAVIFLAIGGGLLSPCFIALLVCCVCAVRDSLCCGICSPSSSSSASSGKTLQTSARLPFRVSLSKRFDAGLDIVSKPLQPAFDAAGHSLRSLSRSLGASGRRQAGAVSAVSEGDPSLPSAPYSDLPSHAAAPAPFVMQSSSTSAGYEGLLPQQQPVYGVGYGVGYGGAQLPPPPSQASTYQQQQLQSQSQFTL